MPPHLLPSLPPSLPPLGLYHAPVVCRYAGFTETKQTQRQPQEPLPLSTANLEPSLDPSGLQFLSSEQWVEALQPLPVLRP